jgi:hypothetical protein
MKKAFAAFAFLFVMVAVQQAHAYAPTNLEIGTDRPGADYSSFNIAADYNICKSACENDDRCQAFTYVHPGVQGPSARCWLKTAAPNRVGSGCCYSGVKRVTTEKGWDRPGSDYSNFDLPWGATAGTCASYCQADARCLAYTFVHPNYQGPNARCWLKNRIPAPVPNAACDSGTVNWR